MVKRRHSNKWNWLQVEQPRLVAAAQRERILVSDRIRSLNRAIQGGMISSRDAKAQLSPKHWGMLE